MIDTHAHIDFPDFDEMRDAMLERFHNAGGEAIIDVGCDMKSSKRAVKMAQEHDNVFASVGIHPHDADSLDEENLARLKELLASPKTVAMGEIGLDFFREPFCDPKTQEEAFRKQLEIAETHKKPIILHCREAYEEILEILKEYKQSGWNGVLHCFTASPDMAKEFLDLGFYIGFTGVITYYKQGSKDEFFFIDTVKSMPEDRILVETDAPYLTPTPHRGEINEPLFVRYVIDKIAEIRNMDAKELEKITSKNAKRLFGI
jgi:TatD DNase family protein